MITEKEAQYYVVEDKIHQDGSRTVIFRRDTPYSRKIRIAKRFKGSTLYSDDRLEIPPEKTASERMESL